MYGDFFIMLAPAVRLRTSFANMCTRGQEGGGKMATTCWYFHVLTNFNDIKLKRV